MVQINVSPFVLKESRFRIDQFNFEKHVSSVEVVPTTPIVKWKGLTKDSSFSLTGNSDWVCNLAYAQDWNTPNSLSRFLYDREGETFDGEFTPIAGGLGFGVSITVVPGSMGGAVDGTAVATVTLGVNGRPTIVDGVDPVASNVEPVV